MKDKCSLETPEVNASYKLNELLQLNSLQGIRLLAGQSGLGNPVERTTVIEAEDLSAWADPENLILTSGYVFRNNEDELIQQITLLSRNHVSGLCVKAAPSGRHLSPLVVQQAEQLGFPLFEIPMTAVFVNIVQESMEEILSKKMSFFQEVQNQTDLLLQTMWRENDPIAALSVVEDAFCNPIIVFDKENELLLTSKSRQLLNKEIQEELIRLLYEHQTFAQLSLHDETETRIVPLHIFNIGSTDDIFLILLEYYGPMHQTERKILEQIGHSLALKIKNALTVKKIHRKYKHQFVENLLTGKLGNDTLNICVAAQTEGYALKLEQAYRVIVLNLKTAREETVFTQKDVTVVRHIIWNLGKDILFDIREGKLILIIEDEENWDQMLRKLLIFARKLDYITSKGEFYFCISDPAQLSDIPQRFLQAKKLSQISECCALKDQIITHDKLGLLYLLSMLPENEVTANFCSRYVKPLRIYDQVHGSCLILTLQTYLNTNCSKSDTAKQLYTHYNTVVYRLSRVEKLLDLSLNDVETQLMLRIAFKLDMLQAH